MDEIVRFLNAGLRIFSFYCVTMGFNSSASAQVIRYVHTDGLGSVSVLTDTNRNVVERREYEPYGASLGASLDGIGYTGHVMDAATGLTYMQQRYYDPSLGKFLSVDPVTAYSSADPRQFNRYAYAFDNPYKFIDPDGRAACADKNCTNSTINGVVPRANYQPPPVNGIAGLPPAIAQKANEGYATTVTFENDKANGASPNQPVATKTANMVEGAISRSGVQSVNINSTTGGVHGARSAHYSGRAVDINRVDGQRVSQNNASATRIQEAARQGGNVRENFGPTIMEKTKYPGGSPSAVMNQALIDAHQNHVHLSGQP